MELLLGIIIGLLVSILIVLSVKRFQTPIERTIKQLENKVKERGEVFIEEDEKVELEHFLDNLPKEF